MGLNGTTTPLPPLWSSFSEYISLSASFHSFIRWEFCVVWRSRLATVGIVCHWTGQFRNSGLCGQVSRGLGCQKLPICLFYHPIYPVPTRLMHHPRLMWVNCHSVRCRVLVMVCLVLMCTPLVAMVKMVSHVCMHHQSVFLLSRLLQRYRKKISSLTEFFGPQIVISFAFKNTLTIMFYFQLFSCVVSSKAAWLVHPCYSQNCQAKFTIRQTAHLL